MHSGFEDYLSPTQKWGEISGIGEYLPAGASDDEALSNVKITTFEYIPCCHS